MSITDLWKYSIELEGKRLEFYEYTFAWAVAISHWRSGGKEVKYNSDLCLAIL